MNLNRAIGGSSKSQHIFGLAADLVCVNLKSEDLFNWCIDNLNNDWHQLILEYPERGNFYPGASSFSWVHVSWAEGDNPKRTSIASSLEKVHERYLIEGFSNRIGNYTHDISKAYLDIEY